ncbi:MAG: regulatory protein RecX [Coriobacteriia bacterium]|nr:regulatory protein RecX [Coriobacteriia bacterium]
MLQRIEVAGPGSKARRLVFSDGEDPRTTSAIAAREIGLVEGAEIERAEVEASLAEVEYDLARERALRLLGYREHSAHELLAKLLDTGYPRHIAQSVADRFVEVSLIDDERFAEAWVRSRVSAGYGPRRIARELKLKGISDALIETALAESQPHEHEVEQACVALRGRRATNKREREKLIRRLVTRGFSLATALEAVGDCEEDPAAE